MKLGVSAEAAVVGDGVVASGGREEPGSAVSLARWEGEGGKVEPASDGRQTGAAGSDVRGLPSLPPGYTSQVAWGFRDPTEGLYYDFYRVYQPPQELHGLGPICHLDEGLSYWLTIFWPAGRPVEEGPICRFINYAQGRRLVGPDLTFSRFSSPLPAREEIPRLQAVAGAAGEPPPAVTYRFFRRIAQRG